MSFTARWLNRLRGKVPMDAVPPDPANESVTLEFPGAIARDFPAEFPLAWPVTERVIEAVRGVDLSPLARHSPGLVDYDWTSYLRLSVIRVVRVLHALSTLQDRRARILDCGSYFGNFAISCAEAGYSVDAVDGYQAYAGALDTCVALQHASGVAVHDFASLGYDLKALPETSFDAVLCMGVIEHIPHTPKPLLDAVTRVLKPGGMLILDTPNLAYLYRRLALLEGRTIFAPIERQYTTAIPFEGHHREYTVDEIQWMLGVAGYVVQTLETFNYSMLAQPEWHGEHADYLREMGRDPSLREVIFAVARRASGPL